VETGLTVKAAEETGKGDDFLQLIKKLSRKLLDNLNITILKNEKKYLDSFKRISLDALIHYSRGLTCEDSEQWEKALSWYKLALKEEPDFEQARKRILQNPAFHHTQ